MIRRIRVTDADIARDLRLRALKTYPLSFGSSYEREAGRDDTFWRENAKRHAQSEDAAIFLAFDGDAADGYTEPSAHPGVSRAPHVQAH